MRAKHKLELLMGIVKGRDLVLFFVFFALIATMLSYAKIGYTKRIEVIARVSGQCDMEVFYQLSGDSDFPKNQVKQFPMVKTGDFAKLGQALDVDSRVIGLKIRFTGVKDGSIELKHITLEGPFKSTVKFDPAKIERKFYTDPSTSTVSRDGEAYVITTKEDSTFIATKHKIDYDKNTAAILLISACTALFIVLALTTTQMSNLRNQRTRDIAFACVFVLFISFHLINSFFNLVENDTNSESRALAKKPPFSISNITKFPKNFNEYFNDTFSLRSQAISLISYLETVYLNVSPMPDKVLIGQAGWLFSAQWGVLDDCRGLTPLSEKNLKEIKDNLLDHKQWLDARGIKYYITVSPDKQSIYADKLPKYFGGKCQDTALNQVISYLGPDFPVKIIDPSAKLLEAKKTNDVYYKTDTHWNFLGGHIGYELVMDEIKKDFPDIKITSIDKLAVKQQKFSGNLARMLSLLNILNEKSRDIDPETDLLKSYRILSDAPKYTVANPRFDERIVTEIAGSSAPKAVLFRDSFCRYQLPYYSESFSRAVYIWSKFGFNQNIIEREKPDIVIDEFVQLTLINRLSNR